MKYAGKPVPVPIGSPASVELPATVYRGRLLGMLFDSDKTFLLPEDRRDHRSRRGPADGDWLLVVREKGKSPFVQPLKLASKKGTFTTAAKGKTAAAPALSRRRSRPAPGRCGA